MKILWIILSVALVLCRISSAFVFIPEGNVRSRQLNFKQDDDDTDENTKPSGPRRFAMPLIGPMVLSEPLIVGSEMTLSPPTPMQWRSLYESVVVHDRRVKLSEKTAIDAAPIVAVIDEVSGMKKITKTDPSNRKNLTGRYATIAAVVGVRTLDGLTENLYDQDEVSSRSVRLIGIGRAVLADLFYVTPSDSTLNDDGENKNHDDDGDKSDYDYEDMGVNIVMAEFEVLHDSGVRHDSEWDVGMKSQFTSPMHALANLHTTANRLGRMHDERRRLVAGLRAARYRLDQAKIRKDEYDFPDHDGFGALFESKNDVTMSVSELITAYASPEEVQASRERVEVVSRLKNYGLNYYSAFSALSELTEVALFELDPFYSPSFREREEYWYEIFGFVAFRALEGYAKPEDIFEALALRSSVVRLERAYELMLQHRIVLETIAHEVSVELLDCGEECTDLW